MSHHQPGGAQQANMRTRWFIALYDYDPTTMSPNPDACEEELRFNEGDSIKVCFQFLEYFFFKNRIIKEIIKFRFLARKILMVFIGVNVVEDVVMYRTIWSKK